MEPKLDNDPICTICGAAIEGPYADSEVCSFRCYERARYNEKQHDGRPYEEPRLLSSNGVKQDE